MAERETDSSSFPAWATTVCSKFRPKLTQIWHLTRAVHPFLANAVGAPDPFPATSVGAPEISVSGNLCATKFKCRQIGLTHRAYLLPYSWIKLYTDLRGVGGGAERVRSRRVAVWLVRRVGVRLGSDPRAERLAACSRPATNAEGLGRA